MRRDGGDPGTGGSVNDVDAAGVENGQNALSGIERHVDGPARDHGLLAPRPQHLVGGDQVVAVRLLAQTGDALQNRKDSGLLGDQRRAGHQGCQEELLAHGNL